ncbi:MAG: RNA polymerase sigma factor [Thiohalomonadaceae bacterium]
MVVINHLLLKRRLRTRIAESRAQLYRTAYAWCHHPDRADDLVQETLLKAIKNLHTLQDEQALRPWLYRIMTNCHRDALRQQRDNLNIDEMELACEDCPEMSAERAHTVLTVRRAIHRLGDDQRKVITLVDLEGFSYSEVAGILEIPMGTVMSRLSRAREQLKQQLLHTTEQVAPHNLNLVRIKHENG